MKILLLAAGCIMLAGCAGAGRIAEKPVSVGNVETIAEMEPVEKVAVLPEPVLFAPTYQGAPERQYTEARRIYNSSPAAVQGAYRHGTLVFVIVVIDANQEKIRYLEGTAMLRAAALLREKYPQLPPQFRLKNRVVEKELDDDTGIYRYALVYRLADIEKAIGKKAGE